LTREKVRKKFPYWLKRTGFEATAQVLIFCQLICCLFESQYQQTNKSLRFTKRNNTAWVLGWK